jgi:hypothetical protein
MAEVFVFLPQMGINSWSRHILYVYVAIGTLMRCTYCRDGYVARLVSWLAGTFH